MRKVHVWQTVACAAIATFVGCKTVTISSPQSNVTVRCEAQTGAAPFQIETAMLGSAKQAVVSKDGYASKSITVNYNSPAVVNVTLERKFNVTANQEGATVYVNGSARGKSPAKGVAINDSNDSVVSVKKQGWLEAKVTVTPETPTNIELVMDQDGSGRRLLNLVPGRDGVTVSTTPIFSDTDVGEDSPNVAQVRRLTSQPHNEYIQNMSLLPDGKSLVTSIVEDTRRTARYNTAPTCGYSTRPSRAHRAVPQRPGTSSISRRMPRWMARRSISRRPVTVVLRSGALT